MVENLELEAGKSRNNISDDIESIQNKIDILKKITTLLIEEFEAMQFVRLYKVESNIELKSEVQKFETHLIKLALRRTNGNQTQAAKLLGLNLTTLNNKIKRLKISLRTNAEQAV